MSKRKKRKLLKALLPLFVLIIIIAVISFNDPPTAAEVPAHPSADISEPELIPEYSGEAYCVLNGNIPYFGTDGLSTEAFESYAELDSLGRCGETLACIGREIMPTEERGSISHVYPSGWVNVPYSFVDGEYLYNRCHLIGFQLTGENDNEQNLITGTRYLNVEGMLPFENMVADYVKETGNHVYYRVIPVFEGSELVSRGVTMEAWSIEDGGEGICFNIYCYNVQPGVIIDYLSGESRMDEEFLSSGEQHTYVLNTGSKKFHEPSCSGANSMKAENRQDYSGTRELLIAQGFEPCGQCKP